MTDDKGYTHVTYVAGHRVEDGSAMVVQNDDGTVELSLGDLARYELRAAKIVMMDVPQVSGEALRFARRAMGLRQADLALLLGVDVGTISRWENGAEPFKRSIQLALAGLIDVVEGVGPDALRDAAEKVRKGVVPTVLKAS